MHTIYSSCNLFFDKMMIFSFIMSSEVQKKKCLETKLSFSCISFIFLSSIERKQIKASFLSHLYSVTLKMVLRAMKAQLLLCFSRQNVYSFSFLQKGYLSKETGTYVHANI